MHPPDKKPEPPSNVETALAGCFVGSVGIIVLAVSLVVIAVIAVVAVASCPAQTASATEQREIRIELTREYSGSVSVLLKGSGGFPASERQGLVFEPFAFSAAGTWGLARVEREVPVWQEGRGYRSSPVPVVLTVLRSPAGEYYVSVRGELLPVQFNPRQRCGGHCAAEWEGTFTVPAPEYVALATPTPVATPTPMLADEARLTLTLEPSRTEITAVDVSLRTNHRIEDMAFQLVLVFGDSRQWSVNRKAIEASSESVDYGWARGRWEDLTGYRIRSLVGAQVWHWVCDASRDYRLTLDCHVERIEDLPDLINAEAASLWVYLADEDGNVNAYIRAESELSTQFTVRVRYAGTDAYSDFCWWSARAPIVGKVERLSCGGRSYDDLEAVSRRGTLVLGGPNEDPDYFHTNVGSVRGELLHCQLHEDSDAKRSVWACEPW